MCNVADAQPITRKKTSEDLAPPWVTESTEDNGESFVLSSKRALQFLYLGGIKHK
ncbi:MAG: hypothetical protein ACM3TU_02245 [Bacillota bacterium]